MITELNYENFQLDKIKENFLGGDVLRKIVKLNLSHNKLHVIAANTFTNNVNLKILILSNNLLTNLNTCFEPLNKLEFLDLSHNLIQCIPKSLFKMNVKLITLKLNSNLISGLRSKSFSHLMILKHLNLKHNLISSLKNCLKPLYYLQTLDLSYNFLPYVSKSLKYNRYLRIVCLNSNILSFISVKAFMNLENLEMLDLSHTRLGVMEDNIFKMNKKMQQLHLKSSNIQISVKLFENFINLTSLILSQNKIREESLNFVFDNLVNLMVLYLDQNKLHKLSNNILGHCKKLQLLDLANNFKLRSLKQEFFQPLINLEFLNIENCHLKCDIDFNMFVTNTKLKLLRMTYVINITGPIPTWLKILKFNGRELISQLPEFVLNSELRELTIVKVVLIGCLKSNFFHQLTSLIVLNLSSNNIQDLDSMVFLELINLEELILNSNSFRDLQSTIFGVENSLKILSLKYCHIQLINCRLFKNLSRLEKLCLSYNNIGNIEENLFVYLTGLKYLYLDNCHLVSLPSNILKKNLQLVKVHLEHNRMTRVPVECLIHLAALKFVYVSSRVLMSESERLNVNYKLVFVA